MDPGFPNERILIARGAVGAGIGALVDWAFYRNEGGIGIYTLYWGAVGAGIGALVDWAF